ncbi:MAG: AI-2E family transporter [Candidatus Cloacimonetes bacterium]|nr:AI-2E family transporter [Candidatus Cloacimonadota bacterium]
MPNPDERTQQKLNLYVLVVLLILLLLAFISITRMFMIPVLLALTFTTLFNPAYAWLLKRMKGKKNLAALVMVALMLLCLLAPTYFLVNLVAKQAVNLFTSVKPMVNHVVNHADEGLLGDIKRLPVLRRINLAGMDWEEQLRKSADSISAAISFIFKRTTGGVFSFVSGLFIMLYTMFFFFRDGQSIIAHIRYLSPLKDEYEDMLIARFAMISRATVKGTIIIGLLQGGMGGVLLLLFGIKTWLLWSLVMVILSVIPLVGPWLVMVPASLYLLLMGDVWQSVVMALITFIVIGNIDNLIRPRLVGHEARLHDLLIFFSTLGGLAVFGIMGFIVGPVIAAMFVAVLDIYGAEFRTQLEPVQTDEASDTGD